MKFGSKFNIYLVLIVVLITWIEITVQQNCQCTVGDYGCGTDCKCISPFFNNVGNVCVKSSALKRIQVGKYSGKFEEVPLPSPTRTVLIEGWGAGGSSALYTAGGGAGYAAYVLQPGPTSIQVRLGEGGSQVSIGGDGYTKGGNGGAGSFPLLNGGGGGGSTAVKLGDVLVFIAAGGGGGGSTLDFSQKDTFYFGGAGGGLVGKNGNNTSSAFGGKGGDQTNGGACGGCTTCQDPNRNGKSTGEGGPGENSPADITSAGGGGGGAGYRGGGGGQRSGACAAGSYSSGGGGGSSWVKDTNGFTVAGNQNLPGSLVDLNDALDFAYGGSSVFPESGGDGVVFISYVDCSVCDQNAECLNVEPICKCKTGYYGNGLVCAPLPNNCNGYSCFPSSFERATFAAINALRINSLEYLNEFTADYVHQFVPATVNFNPVSPVRSDSGLVRAARFEVENRPYNPGTDWQIRIGNTGQCDTKGDKMFMNQFTLKNNPYMKEDGVVFLNNLLCQELNGQCCVFQQCYVFRSFFFKDTPYKYFGNGISSKLNSPNPEQLMTFIYSNDACDPSAVSQNPIYSGSHTKGSDYIKYFCNYFSTVAPTEASVVVGGVKNTLALAYGTQINGVYRLKLGLSNANYHFEFTAGGVNYRYPESGELSANFEVTPTGQANLEGGSVSKPVTNEGLSGTVIGLIVALVIVSVLLLILVSVLLYKRRVRNYNFK